LLLGIDFARIVQNATKLETPVTDESYFNEDLSWKNLMRFTNFYYRKEE
jgi:hypothetical protein